MAREPRERDDRAACWRIWLVTDVYPPDCGGSGWSTHALAKVLRERGHRVEVIGLDPARIGVRRRSYEGIEISEVGVGGARRNPLRRLARRDYTYGTLAAYLNGRLAREPEVDLLHAQHLHSGPPAIAAGRAHGRGTVLTLRDYWPVCLHGTSWWGGANCPGCSTQNLTGCMAEYWEWPRPLARMMVGWAGRRLVTRRDGVSAAHRVLAVSDWVRRRVEAEVPHAALSVVPNLVDLRAVEAAAAEASFETGDAPYLLSAGKLIPTKGFDLLLAALHEINCRTPLLIAGDGPLRHELEAKAAALHLPVRFLGWVERGPLLRLLRDARAVVLPSSWNEPLSRVLLETMALGTPVVAWAGGGNAEAIRTGENGWLVSGPADLAAALAALSSPGERQRMGRAARDCAVQRYAPDAVYPRIEAAYRVALDRAGRMGLRP